MGILKIFIILGTIRAVLGDLPRLPAGKVIFIFRINAAYSHMIVPPSLTITSGLTAKCFEDILP